MSNEKENKGVKADGTPRKRAPGGGRKPVEYAPEAVAAWARLRKLYVFEQLAELMNAEGVQISPSAISKWRAVPDDHVAVFRKITAQPLEMVRPDLTPQADFKRRVAERAERDRLAEAGEASAPLTAEEVLDGIKAADSAD